MRFGIVPLEFKPAAERIIVDGVPDFSRFNIIDAVRDAAKMQHIQVIEVTMDVEHVIPNALTPEVISQLVDLKDELGISYTAHLPLWSLELASFNEFVRQASVESIVSSIRLAEPLEPEAYVLHATGALAAEFSRLDMPVNMVMLICNLMSAIAARSLEDIITRSEINPRLLAVENVEFPFSLTRELVDEYDTSICFDTGHLLTRYSGDESVVEFYRRHRDRIVELHLHDGSYAERDGAVIHRDHIALGEGEMPVREFLMELVRDSFNGPVVFELTATQAKQSLNLIETQVPEAIS
ncbi:MAG: cobamide remodeling phosphodiesterase CbiR [Candidatus Thorarchaeota archaeon]